ncbi:MAG: glycosyltransferase family 4 protein [Cyclobacteriaceae bacterium]
MRILFTTHQGGLAGATFSIIYLAKGLSERGHDVHIACPKNSLLQDELKELEGITCHSIDFAGYFDLGSARLLAKITSLYKIQLVSPQAGRDRNLAIVAKWIFGMSAKLIFVRRQRPRDEPWIKRWIHTKATEKIVMVSNGLKEIFVKKGYPENYLQVIHNGVDQGEFEEGIDEQERINLRQKLGIGNETVVGCVSRLKYQKVLIESLKYLPTDILILFVGIEQKHLNTEIERERPKQRLVFTGEVARQLMPLYYSQFDVTVLASQMDGFGLVVVESMLAGVPVVASKFGGIPDIIVDGESGFLFENSNPKQLAEKIMEILENQELRNALIENAKQRAVDIFSIQATVKKFEELFQGYA